MEVKIEEIKASPYQPRTVFEIEELKESIANNGLLMPLTVRKVNDYYELIDGDRRLRSLKALGMKIAKCSVIEASDALARKMVWKINIDRADYTVEEKAKYLKKLSDVGMTFYQIGKELNEDDQWVLANINVFKFPDDIQQAVWTGKLTMSHIKELEPVIGAGQIDVAEKDLREAIDRKLTAIELRKTVKPQTDKIEEQRLEAAKQAIGTLTDIGATAPTEFSVPEDYEKAAKLLKQKAKTERLSKLTEEDKIQLEEEKTLKQKEKNQKHKEKLDKIKEKAKEEAKEELHDEIKQEILQNPEAVNEIIQKSQLMEEEKTGIINPDPIISGIPSADEQFERLFEAMAKIPPPPENKEDKERLMRGLLIHISELAQRNGLCCPTCKEKQLQWKCGHTILGE